MTVPLSRIGPYFHQAPRLTSLRLRNMICERIHADVIARLDAARHRTTCENCEDGYCYDCILLEMTDAEYEVDSALLTLQRLDSP
jgi:hypothetical protein